MPMKITSVFILSLLLASQLCAERFNAQYTITSGTPIRLKTGSFKVSRVNFQSIHGNTGIIQIMLGVNPNTVCDATNPAHLSFELGPGSSTQPGQSADDPQGANGNTPADIEDLAWACADGSHTNDILLVTGWHKN